MKPLTIQKTKLISRLTLTTLLCGSLVAQSAPAATTPRRTTTAAAAQQQQSVVPGQTGNQSESTTPRRPRPHIRPAVVIPTQPNDDPEPTRPTRPTRPQIDPIPVFPHVDPAPNPTRPPRPTTPVNPTVPPRPVHPVFPGTNPLPTGPVDPGPQNPLPTPHNPLPTNPLPTPENPLPVPVPGAADNAPPTDRIVQADEALARDVQSEVRRMIDRSVDNLADSLKSHGGDERLADLGLSDQFDNLQDLIQKGASLEQIAEQGRALHNALESLSEHADEGDGGLADWADGLAQDVSHAVLLAGISDAIKDAIADGFGPAGPFGPGGLIPGGGPAAGPGPGGPGGFAPGGGGPGPGPGGPGGFAPGGGGGGGGVGPMGPGGLLLPPGGGIGPMACFNINININLWFGGCGCWPVVCCPCLPWGQCCWIGPHVLCCGTGMVGPSWIYFGPPGCCVGLPWCFVEPLPNALPDLHYLGKILLLNPAENLGEIHYLLSGEPFAMDAGMMQEMHRNMTIVRFDRGPGFGEARYTLRPGTYKFIVTDHGWDLVKLAFEAILDNTANASDFYLLLDGDPVAIAARSEQTVRSDFPLLVEFDNGHELVRKQLADEKTYTIGISNSGLWDLFPGNAVDAGAGEAGQAEVIAAAEGVEPPHAIDLPTE